MHHEYRLSVLQLNPGPACRNPTQIIAATCGGFHAVILQEASDHVPQVSEQFVAYIGDTDIAILFNRDTFEPNAAVFTFNEASTSKETWGMVMLKQGHVLWQFLWSVDSCDALPFPAPPPSLFPLSTSTMLWLRNAMLLLTYSVVSAHT